MRLLGGVGSRNRGAVEVSSWLPRSACRMGRRPTLHCRGLELGCRLRYRPLSSDAVRRPPDLVGILVAIQLFQVDDAGALFISPALSDWGPLQECGIDTVIDLEGGLDHCIPTAPNQVLYIYFPIYDEELPNLAKLNAVADLAAGLIRSGHRVLSHCGMGFNRSALVAGLVLLRLGMTGPEAVQRLRSRRQGALFNEVFAAHLDSLGAPER